MKFHLDHIPSKPGYTLSHKDALFFVGSCFSENIGSRFSELRFKTLQNPSGILFNPLSISYCLSNAIDNGEINGQLLLERDGNYYSYLHHSSLNGKTREEMIEKLKQGQQLAHSSLRSCTHLFITFGTAYSYRHKALGTTVANCHKQAGNLFTKELASVDEITALYSALFERLKEFNPSLQIILTVSPVKHLKDGLTQNALSKSTLLLATHKLCERFEHCYYFPAYELVTDDLRDYRFYKPDLAHPNQQAIDYVWEKLATTFFSGETLLLNEKIEKLNRLTAHRPLHPAAPEMAQLLAHRGKLRDEILKLAPYLSL